TKMGAKIGGACTPTITVTGVDQLGGADHTIIPDRIEAGTFIVAAAITGGELEITNCEPSHLHAVIEKLREVGVKIECAGRDKLRVAGNGESHASYKAADVTTAVYPGFPTDMQAQYMALMTQAQGDSVITETIFENRFMHAAELMRLGAQMRISPRSVDVCGP